MLHLLPVPACALSQPLSASSWCSIPGAGPGPGVVTGFPLTTGVVTVTAWLRGQGWHHAGEGALSQTGPHRVRGAEGISCGQEEAQAASPPGPVPSSPRGTGRGLQHHLKWHFSLHILLPFQTNQPDPHVVLQPPFCCPVSAQQGQAWGWGAVWGSPGC